MCNPIQKVEEAYTELKTQVYDPVAKKLEPVLPIIETAALISVGVPAPAASAAVAAANGASVEQIATAAAASYVGGQVGGAAGTAASNAGADAVTANIIGSATGSAASTALKGGSAEDILKSAAGGAAGSGVGSYAAGQGADISTVKGIEQATGTLATTGDPTKALVAGGGGYLTQEAKDSRTQPSAPVEDRSTAAPKTTAEAPLTLDQQLAQLIQQQPPVDRTQDVQLAGPIVEGALPTQGQTGTLPEQVITGEREISPEDLTLVGDVSTAGKQTGPVIDKPLAPEDLPEEEVLPTEKAAPYKPDIFLTGGKSPKAYQPRTTTRLGGVADFAPQTGLSQALTAVRPAGETEGTATGKERQQVWNEASLRLKDALGL